MSHALSEQVVSRARGLMPLLGALLFALLLLLPAVGAPKAKPASKPGKPKAAQTVEVEPPDEAAAFRLLRKAEAITKHPEKATQAQLVQAARDLALAAELSPDFELQPWFHADLGTVLYARAKAKRGAERTALLETARVHFYLAARTHGLDLDRPLASVVGDYEAAGATESFILYHCGLLEYELGRPSEAEIPLNFLLDLADDDPDLKQPEYVQKARTLLAEVKCAERLPALGAPKTGKPKSAKAAEVKPLDEAAARRLLRKTEPTTKHPEKATQVQLAQAGRDLALAAELSPDFELQPWFHADLGTVSYARAKAKQGRERRHLLEKSNVQFRLAALTHGIDVEHAAGGTRPRDVTDFEAAGDATASFILYHCGLLEYELGYPSNAFAPLDLLLAAAADHGLRRPEYVQKARALLVEVKRAEAKKEEEEKSRP